MRRRGNTWLRVSCLVAAMVLCKPVRASGQAVDQWGIRSRTAATQQMLVLAVQQGISALPPTSGQSFLYTFSTEGGTWQRSERLGPTAFRSPRTVGEGKLTLRVATSYFDLNESRGPIDYRVASPAGQTLGYTKFGSDVSVSVGLFNFAANYGVTHRFEMFLSLPVVVNSVSAGQSFVVTVADQNLPLKDVPVAGGPSIPALNRLLECNEIDCLRVRRASVTAYSNALKANGSAGLDFNEGTNAGVGRIDLGAKVVLYPGARYQLTFMPELFFPSPNQAQFAGSDSGAFLPRMVGAAVLDDTLRLHLDLGYDYDFVYDELRAFVWDVGASAAWPNLTVDAGFGGSKYNQGIVWTPSQAGFWTGGGQLIGKIYSVGDNQLGDNFAGFLFGIKCRVMERGVLSGAVNVPITGDGLRPVAFGTVAFEYRVF